MATKTIELKGTLEWAKLFEGNRDKGQYDEDTDGATTVDILLDSSNLKTMQDAGVRKSGKVEGDLTRVKFKRGWADQYGRDWAAGPPKVFGPTGNEWGSNDGLIGNGSEGIVFVEVYDTSKGVGSRLAGVQVINHVVFESEGGGGSGPTISPKDYSGQTTQAAGASQAAKPAGYSPKVAPGDIPF